MIQLAQASAAPFSIVWRPGVPSQNTVVATGAEVATAIRVSGGNLLVQVDDRLGQCFFPGNLGLIDCLGVQFQGFGSSGDNRIVTVKDGATLKNLTLLGNSLNIKGECLTTQAFAWDGVAFCALHDAAFLSLASGASVPAVVVSSPELNIVRSTSIGIANDAAPTVAFAQVNNGSSLVLIGDSGTGINPSTLTPQGIAGPGNLIWAVGPADVIYDFPGLTGITTILREGQAASLLPALGTTGSRPTGNAVAPGQMFFDTTLNRPIWFVGPGWVDSAGAPA
jgi:hypothetical protein